MCINHWSMPGHYQDNIYISIYHLTQKNLSFFPKYFVLDFSAFCPLQATHMDRGTYHLSLVSPLYAAKLVLSYMLHRDTGKQGPEQDDSAELPEPSPTYQPPQSFTANTPSTLLGPKVTRSLFAKWGRILVLSPNNIYFI